MPDAGMPGLSCCPFPDSQALTVPVPTHQDLVTLLRARTSLLLIESAAETRVIDGFRHAITQPLRPLYRRSITDGLKRLGLDSEEERNTPPNASLMLQWINQQRAASVYLLLNFFSPACAIR